MHSARRAVAIEHVPAQRELEGPGDEVEPADRRRAVAPGLRGPGVRLHAAARGTVAEVRRDDRQHRGYGHGDGPASGGPVGGRTVTSWGPAASRPASTAADEHHDGRRLPQQREARGIGGERDEHEDGRDRRSRGRDGAQVEVAETEPGEVEQGRRGAERHAAGRAGRLRCTAVVRVPVRSGPVIPATPSMSTGAEGNTAWPGPVPDGDSQPAPRCARITGMPFSIGDLLRSPSDLAAAARSVLGWTDEAVQVVADLPARVAALLGRGRSPRGTGGATPGPGGRRDRPGRTPSSNGWSGSPATRSRSSSGSSRHRRRGRRAGVGRSDQRRSPGPAQGLPAHDGAGEHRCCSTSSTSSRSTNCTAPDRLIDHVPEFTEHMETDIMPVLAKLDQVGPDVHELLDVLKDVPAGHPGRAGVLAAPPARRRPGGRSWPTSARPPSRPSTAS